MSDPVSQRPTTGPQADDGEEATGTNEQVALDQTMMSDSGGDPDDPFAATMAMNAIPSAEQRAVRQQLANPPQHAEEATSSERTMPMTPEQVQESIRQLESVQFESPSGAQPSGPQRRTVVENPDVVQQAMAYAKTQPEADFQIPPGLSAMGPRQSSRPIAPTIAERAIPATQAVQTPHIPATQANPRPPSVAPELAPETGPQPAAGGTPMGLIIAIVVVLALILAGLVFVVILATG